MAFLCTQNNQCTRIMHINVFTVQSVKPLKFAPIIQYSSCFLYNPGIPSL